MAVHGIGQQSRGEETLLTQWWPAMADGLRRAGAEHGVMRSAVAMAFYGDVFRPDGEFLAVGDPPYRAADVGHGFEEELLLAWWQAAAEHDPTVVPPDAADTLMATPRLVQAALRALSASPFFAGVALRAMVFDLKQVHRYLLDPKVREQARSRVMEAIGPGASP
ncbi:hypothetical protein ACFV6E_36520 [Streptomyces sp. NPDC059785]|uniref:hypothetical protein n=1 Tax=Streptomyces sp. NPDC059785 TaxID=3346945 RepID=UPI0036600EEB